MTPNDLYEELASIVVGVVKRPFRPEPVTKAEMSEITYQVLRLAERMEEQNGNTGNQENKRSGDSQAGMPKA